MCGIIGIIGKDVNEIPESNIDLMINSLAHRGPDNKGKVRFDNCILAHTRLAIIDLTSGQQPMRDNTRNITITFNGEIYNYRELRNILEKIGHKFSTESDTEVILKSYIEYGEDCPKHLEGMFSFAIWDEDNKILFCARDRFGEKPFYYAKSETGLLVFASEIKAIFSSNLINKEINKETIDSYLNVMYIPPDITVYKEINVLYPASSMTMTNDQIKIRKYWQLEKKKLNISYEEAKEKAKQLIEKAVKKMLIADVEVGTFLSGGVDSTLITYYAQKNSTKPIKTFSLGYENHINELPYAAKASEKFGTDHYTLQAKGNMIEELIGVTKYLDEPHGDCSNFPQYLVSRLASSKVKVALTGDGADELFMGYGRYWRHHNLSWKAHFIEKAFFSPFKGFVNSILIFTSKEKSNLWIEPVKNIPLVHKEVKDAKISDIEKINLFDLTYYLPGQLLVKGDRTSMMCSLEIRCPFLDRELAEFVYNLPIEFKVDKHGGKLILKDILADIMPADFVYRRKQGFGAPVIEWLLVPEMKKLLEETLNSNSEIYQYFKKTEVSKIIDRFYKYKKESDSYKAWSIFNLALWLKFR